MEIEAGPSSPKPPKVPLPTSPVAPVRSSIESSRSNDAVAQLEAELAVVRNEKEVLGGQYRGLLGKLTAMRQSLGEKLREDAVSIPKA